MPDHPTRLPVALRAALAGMLVLGFGLVPLAPAASADGGLTMQAHALLEGHVRAGAWFGIAVDVANGGPTVTGELRIAGGSDSRTRFGTPVELATGSRKQVLLYALPPAFGNNVTVELVSGDTVVARAVVAIALHDQTQLVVGVVSENPAKIVGELDLLPSPSGAQATIVPLQVPDLPERVQAWAAVDRLVWQDTDTSTLTAPQVAALRGWVAGGGRLVIVGGTSGPDELNALPDDLLPYRPTTTLDIDPSVLRPILGGVPEGAKTLTAMGGDAGHGRTLATSGDRVIAADMPFGSGDVTLLGFDPTTSWIAQGDTWDAPMWRRLLPQRSGGTTALTDDSQIVGAVSNLPSLALPPIGGLLVLLVGYIVLIGPVNYLVLRWLDRREWAWFTVPALIVVFTVGSFGIGALLRGSDVIVHEVAIVRGAPGTDQATALSYVGIFSPTRASFQVRVPGDALLASPMNGDVFGTSNSGLDVLEGDPSKIRDLDVGFGSLRTVRAEAPATAPVITGDLRLENNRIVGTVTNTSDRTLEAPAVVFGGSSATLADLAPGKTANVSVVLVANPFNQGSLSDRIVGQVDFDQNGSAVGDSTQRKIIRRSVIDQLTTDPFTGFQGSLSTDAAMLLAWGEDPVVPVEIEDQKVRRVTEVLYEVPLGLKISGPVTFSGDLLRASALETDANFFNKDPFTLSFGLGSVRMSYRPTEFDGTFAADKVVVAMSFGGDPTVPGGATVPLKEIKRCDPSTDKTCPRANDGFPELDVLDVKTGDWVQFEHLAQGSAYELEDASRWIDPASGELQVRFENQGTDGVSFQFSPVISGTVR